MTPTTQTDARCREARRLRDSGLTWAKVAEELGVSIGTAHQWANGRYTGRGYQPVAAGETNVWFRQKIGVGVERCPRRRQG